MFAINPFPHASSKPDSASQRKNVEQTGKRACSSTPPTTKSWRTKSLSDSYRDPQVVPFFMMRDHFEALLRPLFGEDADFRHVERHTDELRFRVDWKIPEEGRPNKRSRPIEIILTSEVLDDYEDAPRDEDRADMERRIVEYMERRLASFNPEHNLRPEQPVPVEEWLISPQIASP